MAMSSSNMATHADLPSPPRPDTIEGNTHTLDIHIENLKSLRSILTESGDKLHGPSVRLEQGAIGPSNPSPPEPMSVIERLANRHEQVSRLLNECFEQAGRIASGLN